eukprot:COSAG06_NODE_769_length_12440_cov_7.241796_2_plen_93_part_00
MREPGRAGWALAAEQQEDGAASRVPGLVVLVALLPVHGRLVVAAVVERLREPGLRGRGAADEGVQVVAAGEQRAVEPDGVGGVAVAGRAGQP